MKKVNDHPPKQFYFFIGTTADFIKLSPVLDELKKRKKSFKIITSGQNYIGFKELEPLIGKYTPYYSFKHKTINISGAIYINFLIWILLSLFIYFPFFKKELKGSDKKNTFFIVHGDTVTSLLGTFIGKLFRLKVVHIESGYRSFNLLEPFPEELCRQSVSFLTDIHFCPNDWCLSNIRKRKGVKINTYLNTAYEICMKALKVKLNSLKLKLPSKFFILILHRQEHMLFQRNLTKKYIKILTSFAKPNLKCIFIQHFITEKFLKKENLIGEIKKNPNVIVTSRLPYIEFIKVLYRSEFITSDGGGNQQEAYYLGKPCLILRKYTEQIEGLNSNAVLAKDDTNIIENFLENYKSKNSPRVISKTSPSKIIVDHLLET